MKINFSHKTNDEVLFEQTEISLKANKINFLLGPNGSGKSTIAFSIAQLKKMNNISFTEEGKILNKKKLKYLKKNTRIIFQNPNQQILHQTLENELFLENKNVTKKEAINVLREFGIDDKLQKNISELSYGQKKIFLILEAIFSKPKLLILDEPTANLDWKTKNNIITLLQKYLKINPDSYLLIISHDLEIINEYYECLFIIKDKKIFTYDKKDYPELTKEIMYDLYDWLPLYGKIIEEMKKISLEKQDFIDIFLENKKNER